jgi:hypothetical protein
MRLLGALAPKTEDGMIVGANTTVLAAAAVLLRNCRRLRAIAFFVLLLFRFLACLSLCKPEFLYLFGAVLSYQILSSMTT